MTKDEKKWHELDMKSLASRLSGVWEIEEISVRGIDEMTMPEYCKKHVFIRTLFDPSSWTVDSNNPEDIALVRWCVRAKNLEGNLEIVSDQPVGRFSISLAKVVGGDMDRFPDIASFINETQWVLEEEQWNSWHLQDELSLRFDHEDKYVLWVKMGKRIRRQDEEERLPPSPD
jgi:hypothetical protein